MSEKQTTQEQAARRIAGLLAMAEDAAKRGDEQLRDTYLAKATGLQHEYAIDAVLLEQSGQKVAEGIGHQDFCEESNTPLIKAKRELIAALARLHRGHPVMMGAFKKDDNGQIRYKDGKPLYDRRALIRVYAHESDLAFIAQMYLSLLLQMQSMMAVDEKKYAEETQEKVTNKWRVSYAHAWVRRVYIRLWEVKNRQDRDTASSAPGAALMLRDKGQLVEQHVSNVHGKMKNVRHKDESGSSAAGAYAGRQAAERADLATSAPGPAPGQP